MVEQVAQRRKGGDVQRARRNRDPTRKLSPRTKPMPAPSPSRAAAIPNLGEFKDAVILKTFGEVPEDFGPLESA
jgi:hypothetical protein